MRQGFGLLFSIIFHASLAAIALYGLGSDVVKINMDQPVYTVDLVSLAPPLSGPAPVVEAVQDVPAQAKAPEVVAEPEPVVETKPVPVVEAEPEPTDISPTKKDKPVIQTKKEPKPENKPAKEPKPKPKPKPKPQKTAQELLAEGLATAKAKAAQEEKQKSRALQSELAALKEQEGQQVYGHGGQPTGKAGGVTGGSGSGLSEVYALIVGSAIKKNWRYPSFSGEANFLVSIEISLGDDGRILSSKVLESSGNSEFDNSALRAIRETERVERPRTPRDRVIRLNFNSQELAE